LLQTQHLQLQVTLLNSRKSIHVDKQAGYRVSVTVDFAVKKESGQNTTIFVDNNRFDGINGMRRI